MKKISRISAGAILLVGVASAPLPASAEVTSITLPEPKNSLRPGAGAGMTANFCIICHSTDYIVIQPPLRRDQWLDIVDKMRKSFGCPLPASDVDKVVDYLTHTYGTGR